MIFKDKLANYQNAKKQSSEEKQKTKELKSRRRDNGVWVKIPPEKKAETLLCYVVTFFRQIKILMNNKMGRKISTRIC